MALYRSVARIPGTDGEVLVYLRHRLHDTIPEILGPIPEMTNVGISKRLKRGWEYRHVLDLPLPANTKVSYSLYGKEYAKITS